MDDIIDIEVKHQTKTLMAYTYETLEDWRSRQEGRWYKVERNPVGSTDEWWVEISSDKEKYTYGAGSDQLWKAVREIFQPGTRAGDEIYGD